jgi:electron transport complex protein RnfG
VYSITKPSIEAQEQIALTASLKDIFPEAETFEDVTESLKSESADIPFQNAILVKGKDAPLGLAVKASGPSYGGKAVVLVGVELNRSIAGVRILQLNDTPGLGANAKNPSFYVNKAEKITFPGQFTGKFATDAFVVKDDIVAITASTITSNALAKIVKTVVDAAVIWLENSTVSESTAAEEAAETGSTGGN